jgi:enoyl-CoA hydratase/carnithine racemase
MVEADEALRIGLVDRVVPDDQVLTTALELARSFVGGPALALRAAKQAIDSGLDADLTTGLEIERLSFSGLFATEDREIGMRSFREDGPGKARFVGR